MIKVGLTGGIGSGKSTIARAFEVLGTPVYYADARSKHLTVTDQRIISGLKEIIGPDVYFADGSLDKKRMAAAIFSNKEQLAKVNALIHPIVAADFEQWAREQAKRGIKYVVHEAAILIENGSYRNFDMILLATAPEQVRVTRTAIRDSATPEQILARIRNQMPDEQKLPYATHVLTTDDHQPVLKHIISIHNKLSQ